MRILIAEDDPVTREAVEASLKKEGFEVLVAADGQEAIDTWRQHRPELVCLDIMMPQIDGFEVCRLIRKEDAKVPILFLSAKNEEIDVVVGLELGADDFIRKPFGKQELVARVRSTLRRSQIDDEEQASFDMGPLTIYPKELRCEIDSNSIDLTPREVSILALLNAKVGEVVSRDEMMESCWGVDYFPESRTLDQHISKLRKRIEPNPDSVIIIETVRGVGYRYRS